MGRPRAAAFVALTMGLVFACSLARGQVFPPRQTHPSREPGPAPGQQGQMPLTRTIPFVAILGDPTKSFIHISNMRSAVDTTFQLGRSLGGRIALDKYTHEAGNGKKCFIHVNGLSNPPTIKAEGRELKMQYVIPALQFKTYYEAYTGEGDSALSDLVAERVTIDLYWTPTVDQRQMPTFHSIRVTVSGNVKEAAKCTHFFDVIFPVNVCKAASDYFNQLKPAIENGIREALLLPQTRMPFEQEVFQFVRADLLAKAGINPMSAAQVEILQAEFRGTDYVASYQPR